MEQRLGDSWFSSATDSILVNVKVFSVLVCLIFAFGVVDNGVRFWAFNSMETLSLLLVNALGLAGILTSFTLWWFLFQRTEPLVYLLCSGFAAIWFIVGIFVLSMVFAIAEAVDLSQKVSQ